MLHGAAQERTGAAFSGSRVHAEAAGANAHVPRPRRRKSCAHALTRPWRGAPVEPVRRVDARPCGLRPGCAVEGDGFARQLTRRALTSFSCAWPKHPAGGDPDMTITKILSGFAACCALLVGAGARANDDHHSKDGEKVHADLAGWQEVPSIASGGTAVFRARIADDDLSFEW